MVRECSMHEVELKDKSEAIKLLVGVRIGGDHVGRECVFVGWIQLAHDGVL